MFERKKYRQARLCFQRALRPDRATIANAYFLREEAGKVSVGRDRTQRSAAFVEAAREFMQCVEIAPSQASTYYCTAARCYEEAGDKRRAAKAYVQGGEYTKPTELWDSLGMFDEAIGLIEKHEDEIDAGVREQAVKHGKTHYYKKKDYKKASKLFDSPEEEMGYLEERGLDDHLSVRLEMLGRLAEAAELHLEENRTSEAIRLFLLDGENAHSLRRGVDCLLQAFWDELSFGMSPESTALQELLNVRSTIPEKSISQLTESQQLEVCGLMLLYLSCSDYPTRHNFLQHWVPRT
jgi:tetratricopeptide (TPR) repeat protein